MGTLINGLGGERGFGENSVSRNDDSYSSAIDITSVFDGGINLFGNVYENMYVNTNGNITFNSGLSTFTPGTISAGSTPIFAPYWADVDTRAGEVTATTSTSVEIDYSLNAYRTYLDDDDNYFENLVVTSAISNFDITSFDLSSQSSFENSVSSLISNDLSGTDLSVYYSFLESVQDEIDTQLGDSNYSTEGNSTGSNLVWYDLDVDTDTITVTWDDVGYYSYQMDKTNAFQLQLKNTGDGQVDISFIYEDINWTTGSASGGTNGFGGTVARAGYSAGDSEHYFEIPFSGDQEGMLDLEDYQVAGQSESGVWELSILDGNIEGIGLENSDDTVAGTSSSDILDGRSGDDILEGGYGNDTLIGGLGNDSLFGGFGNDIFFTGEGLDAIYGGEGLDTVSYEDNFNAYNFSDIYDYFSIIDDENTSSDSLYDVEYISFEDITISQDEILDLISLQESVTRLYTALLGRTPDNSGLNYWLNDVSIGNTVQGISSAFAGSEEYEARFGAQSNEEFINQLYNNILDRDADSAGYDYWLNEIANTGNRTGMIVSFSDSEEYIDETEEEVASYLDNANLTDYVTEVEEDAEILVYWSVRDLDGYNAGGNHHFIIIEGVEESDYPNIEFVDFSDTSDVRGFTLEGVNRVIYEDGNLIENNAGGSLDAVSNNDASIAAIKEGYDGVSGLTDYDIENHLLTAPDGMTNEEFVDALISAYTAYEYNELLYPVEYDLTGEEWFNSENNTGNCATWVNSLLDYVGMSIEEREEAGEFSGIDWGEEELIDSVYFSPDFDSYSADTGLVIA